MKREDALDYHSSGRPGKIAVVPTKPLNNQRDLALAYSPGVALPCLEIKANPEEAYRYTAKGNLVGVVTNGTAVLGLDADEIPFRRISICLFGIRLDLEAR